MPSARDERLAALRTQTEELLRAGERGASAWGRAERVYGVARHLARQEEADRFVVGVAALLYQLPEIVREELLTWLALPPEATLAVREALLGVLGGVTRGGSLESRDLWHAPRLDQLGATGIAEALLAAPADDGEWHERVDPFALMRELAPDRYAVDRLYARVATLPQEMQTPTARALAMRRAGIMLFFLEALREEFAEGLPDALLPEGDWLVPREEG
jgi:uncharacterized protein